MSHFTNIASGTIGAESWSTSSTQLDNERRCFHELAPLVLLVAAVDLGVQVCALVLRHPLAPIDDREFELRSVRSINGLVEPDNPPALPSASKRSHCTEKIASQQPDPPAALAGTTAPVPAPP